MAKVLNCPCPPVDMPPIAITRSGFGATPDEAVDNVLAQIGDELAKETAAQVASFACAAAHKGSVCMPAFAWEPKVASEDGPVKYDFKRPDQTFYFYLLSMIYEGTVSCKSIKLGS